MARQFTHAFIYDTAFTSSRPYSYNHVTWQSWLHSDPISECSQNVWFECPYVLSSAPNVWLRPVEHLCTCVAFARSVVSVNVLKWIELEQSRQHQLHSRMPKSTCLMKRYRGRQMVYFDLRLVQIGDHHSMLEVIHGELLLIARCAANSPWWYSTAPQDSCVRGLCWLLAIKIALVVDVCMYIPMSYINWMDEWVVSWVRPVMTWDFRHTK